MEIINFLIDNYNIPILSAFLLGLLSSISPCRLAANVGVLAYLSKELKSAKQIILNGLVYTIGRAISYTLLGLLIYLGISNFYISNIFLAWGSLLLGPIFIFFGLIMLRVLKFNLNFSSRKLESFKKYLSTKGYLGTLLLGMLLALAFCPYSGVLFFGALIPLALESSGGSLFFLMFALGTGIAVIVFSIVLAFSIKNISKVFNFFQKIEKFNRVFASLVFILVGLYYLQFLIKYLYNLI